MMAKGKSVINRADLDERGQGMFDRFAGNAGITNGTMTRDQFTQAMSAMGGGRGGRGNRVAAKPRRQCLGRRWWLGGNTPAADPMGSMAEAAFRKLDANGDGVLNYDEMTDSLKAEKDKWDVNKDGMIDFNEFKAYLQARMQAITGGGNEGSGIADAEGERAEEEKKVVVYRAGKLPKELPSRFAEMDTDHDAQVGLYEWKHSGRSLEEFASMDRNGDGFLTIEEVLHATRPSREAAPNGRMIASMGNQAMGMGDGAVMMMQRNYPPGNGDMTTRPGRGSRGQGKTRGDNAGGRGKGNPGGGKSRGRGGRGGGGGAPGGGGGAGAGGFIPDDDI